MVADTSSIVMACARLHNYIIDMDVPPTMINDDEDDNIIAVPHAPDGMGYTPVMLDPNEDFVKVDGVSQARAAIVSEISREGLIITSKEINLDWYMKKDLKKC